MKAQHPISRAIIEVPDKCQWQAIDGDGDVLFSENEPICEGKHFWLVPATGEWYRDTSAGYSGKFKTYRGFRGTLKRIEPLEQKEPSFYLVWKATSNYTAKRHIDFASAANEADRLIEKHPDATFFVLKAVKKVECERQIKHTPLD